MLPSESEEFDISCFPERDGTPFRRSCRITYTPSGPYVDVSSEARSPKVWSCICSTNYRTVTRWIKLLRRDCGTSEEGLVSFPVECLSSREYPLCKCRAIAIIRAIDTLQNFEESKCKFLVINSNLRFI